MHFFKIFVNPLIIIDSVVLSLCLRTNVTCKKGKGPRSLVAVSGVAVRVQCVMHGHSIGSDLSCRCTFTAGSTDRVFQPRDGIELATFSTVVKRCNPLNHRIVTCNPLSLTYGSRLTIILKFKKGLSFKVENFWYK